jgi:hypothetical protein
MIERLKSAALIALTLLLGAQIYFSLTVSAGESLRALAAGLLETAPVPGAQTAEELLPETAALPAQIAVAGPTGVFCARTPEEYDRLYAHVRGFYQEALGSSGAPLPVTQGDYLAALTAPALFMRFDAALPIWMHQAWIEGQSDLPDTPVSALAVALLDGKATLFFSDGAGGYYRCATAAQGAGLDALCRDAGEGNCVFAAEDPVLSHLPGDTVIFDGALALPGYRVTAPFYAGQIELPRQLFEVFDIRPGLYTYAASVSGGIFYVDGVHELTAGAAGELAYADTSGSDALTAGLAPGSRAEIIRVVEAARSRVTRAWAIAEGFGSLTLDHVDYDGAAGQYRIVFELQAGGVFVDLPTPPAVVEVTNGSLTAVMVRPCAAESLEAPALDFRQYAAAAAPRGLALAYVPDGGSAYLPQPVIREDA